MTIRTAAKGIALIALTSLLGACIMLPPPPPPHAMACRPGEHGGPPPQGGPGCGPAPGFAGGDGMPPPAR